MDQRLSERQQEFLDFLTEFKQMHGKAPTFKEIAIGMGISSKGSISAMVGTLAEMGFVEKAHGVYRGTQVRHPVQASR